MRQTERAINAIAQLFGDQSVSAKATLDYLTEIREYVNDRIQALKVDVEEDEDDD